jgi:transcriptional regulator with XRE-family HTH domain
LFFVGEELRQIRKQHGYTTEELAEEIHVSQGQLSKYELNYYPITLEQVIHICKVVDDFKLYKVWMKRLEELLESQIPQDIRGVS